MRTLRTLLLVVFLVGLVALDVAFGLRRFADRREEWRRGVRDATASALERLADDLERTAAVAERHARWAGALLEEQRALPAEAFTALFASAPDLTRLEIASDRPAWSVLRFADGSLRAAALPETGAPLAGGLVLAPDGEEPEELRATWVAPATEAGGALAVVAVHDLWPLRERLRAFDVHGARAALRFEAAAPPAAGERVERPLPLLPGWQLSVDLPEAALHPPGDWRRQHIVVTLWIMLAVTAGLLFAGGVFLRLSTRSFRLHETERYLRWIRRLTDRYRALMEGAADMILIVDPDSEAVRESNAAARQELGLPAAEVPSPDEAQPAAPPGPTRVLADLFAGEQLAKLREAVRRAVAAPGRPEAASEVRVTTADGRDLVVDARIAAVDLGAEHIVEVSLRDLTRQKEIERQLQTAERLSSLGLLTAGVAHEINNPLEGIGNYLALAAEEELDPRVRAEYLTRVRHGFSRIRDIVRDLLQFSRPQLGRGPVDLVLVVERALALAAYSKVFQGVAVVRRLPRSLPIAGDAGRLEQVVLNLLLNAARACNGGKIVLSGRASTPDEAGRESVELTVEDEGPGILSQHLDRVFDPFFSTEGGTGLGLSVSYGIVQVHGGTLSAANRPEGGARFTLRLPAEAAPVEHPALVVAPREEGRP